MKKIPLIVLMLSLGGCGGGNSPEATTFAADGPVVVQPAAPAVDTRAVDSARFLSEAYGDGLGEIQLAQLALQKSTNNDVRGFAQRMIDHHSKVLAQLAALAQARNVALPGNVSTAQQAEADRLGALAGEAFDRAYMTNNVAAHEKDLTDAKLQAARGGDVDVRMLADISLPIVDIHLAMAKDILYLLDSTAFLTGSYQDGLGEIRLAQLALQKGSGENVRRYAQQMIDDHAKSNARIAALARDRNITLPATIAPSVQIAAEEFARFSGVDFDQTYMDDSAIMHLKGLRYALQQAQRGRDTDVRLLAFQKLPVVGAHLIRAVDIDRRLEPSFLYRAYQDGKGEVALAQIALQKSSDARVSAYAQQMITDHRTINAQIMQLAQTRNLALPLGLSPDQLKLAIELSDTAGARFDRAYMAANVSEHRKLVTALTQQGQSAPDQDVRSFAQNTLPLAEAHLTTALEIDRQQASAATPP